MSTFRKWMTDTLDWDDIHGLAVHGAAAGWPGLTYYSDTTALYDRFGEEIWAAAEEDAESIGHKHVLEFVAGFRGGIDVRSQTQLANLLVWYMAERTAHALVDEAEERDYHYAVNA